MKKILDILKYTLLFALSIFMMWYALKGINFELVKDQLKNANYFWIGVSVLMGTAGYWSRAVRWKMQIDPTGYKASLADTYHAMMVGYLANLVLPRMGEVIRCSVLKRTDSIPVKVSLGTVITERVIDLIILATLLAALFFIEFDRLSDFLISLVSDKYSTLEANQNLIYAIGGILILLGIVSMALVFIFLSRLRQNTVFMKLVNFVKGVLEGVFSIRKMDQKAAFTFHTVFVWLMYFGMSYVAFFALPVTSHLGLAAGLAILVIGGMGMAAPVQGGIGIYH
ncbi:MAG: flippase-like domain-containing protein, partial [Hymenobacteraceae bacterium]|nr:flippase-like domain-containing protein [Hymenobacteraceae bacterium]MDX5394614.1 flippase-like domain-containing protein [Hymenobacteraceae bacterium]MDX5510645.1 flippase-like domain-containing protein [Hymenobacteraceae bacterium]